MHRYSDCKKQVIDMLDSDELEFVLFCIESVATELKTNGKTIYDAFTKKSNILNDYIIPCYDVLHTQGKEYIVEDLISKMNAEGVMT